MGLEVCAGKGTTAKEAMKTGLWQSCDPVPGTITVNIGDALQYWSDDRLKSTFHRVRVPRGNDYKVCIIARTLSNVLSKDPFMLYRAQLHGYSCLSQATVDILIYDIRLVIVIFDIHTSRHTYTHKFDSGIC